MLPCIQDNSVGIFNGRGHVINRYPSLSPPYRVLLVEDEENFGRMLKKRLENEDGHTVDLALDYQRGFELGCEKNFKYHAAIVDLHLGGEDMAQLEGLDLIRNLQDEGSLYSFLVFSGHHDFETRVKAFEMGAYNFIRKPDGSEKFYEELSAALDSLISQYLEKIRESLSQEGRESPTPPTDIIQRGPLKIVTNDKSVFVSDKEIKGITEMQYTVLLYLMMKKFASMDQLLTHVYGDDINPDQYFSHRDTIQSFISKVRKTIQKETQINPILYQKKAYSIFWPAED